MNAEMEFSEMVRNLRKKNGLTQENIATKLGTTQATICSWESGKNFPTIYHTHSLSTLFDMDPFEISRTIEYSMSKKREQKLSEKFIEKCSQIQVREETLLDKAAISIASGLASSLPTFLTEEKCRNIAQTAYGIATALMIEKANREA